eukprot:9092331-Lingulodinium_polyedra.AAC.1
MGVGVGPPAAGVLQPRCPASNARAPDPGRPNRCRVRSSVPGILGRVLSNEHKLAGDVSAAEGLQKLLCLASIEIKGSDN